MRTLSGPDLRLLEALNAPEHRWYPLLTLCQAADMPLYAVQACLHALRRFRLVTQRDARGPTEYSITTLGVAELHDRGLPESLQLELRG